MERQFDAAPVYVDFVCDECKAGTMVVAGEPCLDSENRVCYQHKCSNADCTNIQEFYCRYPDLRWKAIGKVKNAP